MKFNTFLTFIKLSFPKIMLSSYIVANIRLLCILHKTLSRQKRMHLIKGLPRLTPSQKLCLEHFNDTQTGIEASLVCLWLSIIRPVWLNGQVFVYKISGCWFETLCCHIERSVSTCFFNIAIFPISFSNAKWIWILLESLMIEIYICWNFIWIIFQEGWNKLK